MKKRGTSRLSILLAICLIVTAIPMSSAADNTRATTDTSLAGTYILYNRFMDTFAGVASTSYTQGTAVQQQQYSGLSPQIWTVTPVSGTTNRYYIKMGSLCIGTASNGNTAYLQIPYGTSATYQQWYLDPIQVIDGRYGRYKIRTANSYYAASLVLSVDATLNSQLRLSSYINDSTYSDEWFLCPIDEAAINLEVRYESGYAARYSSPTSTLNAHMKEIQKRYITEFGIWINYSSPSSIQTLADQCNASLNGYCQCGTCVNGGSGNIQTYHHTNIHNIIYNLSLPTPANMFRLLFIGRYTCTASDHTGAVRTVALHM